MSKAVEQEAIELISIIRAAESWSNEYEKDPVSHAKLIKNEARWTVAMYKFFKQMAIESDKFINWYNYRGQVKADYDVNVIIDESLSDDYSTEFVRISLEFVTVITAAGAQAGETIYAIPLGITSLDANIRSLSTKHVASLVGKRVLPDGSIVANPKAEYNVLQTVREDIAQSIKESLALGESIQDAQARVQAVIKNPKRAERIARTESINAYQSGLTQFGLDSGAVGKVWLDVGATDVCADYASEGAVPFVYLYGGSLHGPVAHPGCRCGRRLIYQREWDTIKR